MRRRLSGDLHLHGYSSAFIYGIIAGIVVGPCVGPVLVGILTFVAKSQNLWLGFWLLFDFAFGMGVLFLVIGFSSQATKLLPKSGPWMNVVKYFFGVLLIGASLFYARLLIPRSTQSTQSQSQQSLQWTPFTEQDFVNAVALHKPIMIDCWAEWCTACSELESKTFTDPEFIAMAKKFTLFKLDFTQENALNQKAKEIYKIIGLPNLIIFNSKGIWLPNLTTTELIEARPLVDKMRQAL
jgi:thioredoxin:protein disulfide reductase